MSNYGLTDRELTVLNRIAAGEADKEIASDLAISVRTVSGHVGNVLAKMAAGCRTEAACRAIREGLIA